MESTVTMVTIEVGRIVKVQKLAFQLPDGQFLNWQGQPGTQKQAQTFWTEFFARRFASGCGYFVSN